MIKIMAIDDDKAYLDYLSKVVFMPPEKEFKLVQTISNMQDSHNIQFMLQKIQETQPDIILMDFSFALVGKPHDFGIELVKIILQKYPAQKIIMLVGDQDDTDPARFEKIFRSFQAGASAYLGKREIANYREAINEVIHGDSYVTNDARKIILKGLKKESALAREKYKMTSRHLEVIWHLSNDLSIKQIANEMRNEEGKPLNVHTVNFHLRTIRPNLMGKNANGTLQGIVAKALREHLIE